LTIETHLMSTKYFVSLGLSSTECPLFNCGFKRFKNYGKDKKRSHCLDPINHFGEVVSQQNM
jgi:hypothetical protein